MPEEQATARGFEKSEEVTIRVERGQGRCGLSVEPNPLRLSIEEKQTASWRINGATEFDIEFEEGSPFEGKQYNQGTAKSLKPLKKGEYKYKVTVRGCGVLDPEVIVGS